MQFTDPRSGEVLWNKRPFLAKSWRDSALFDALDTEAATFKH
jgi:hypothetical protein